jgi:hypothetical protein
VPIFVSPQVAVGHSPDKRPDKSASDADRDSLIFAPRKATPTLNEASDNAAGEKGHGADSDDSPPCMSSFPNGFRYLT